MPFKVELQLHYSNVIINADCLTYKSNTVYDAYNFVKDSKVKVCFLDLFKTISVEDKLDEKWSEVQRNHDKNWPLKGIKNPEQFF